MSFLAKIFGSALSPVVSLVGDVISKRQDRKQKMLELNGAMHVQKLKNIEAGRLSEVEWNTNSIQKAGWRPGFLTIVLSLPMILVFWPAAVPVMEAGFAALDTTPVWYRSAIAVMISSAFGFKKFADWQMQKHYTLPDPQSKIKDLKE